MENRIRLVIATNILDIGGAERTVQTIALGMDKSRFDVTVLAMERGGPRQKLLEDQGVRVLVGDGTIATIQTLMPNPQVDILHFHRSGQREGGLHKQVVEYLRPHKLMETNIFAFHDPDLAAQFDMQVYKSKMMLTKRVWRGHAHEPADCLKQRVIYNPVRVNSFDGYALHASERNALRSKLGIAPTDIVIGRIGRNDTVKWGDLILSALPTVLKAHPQVKVLFRTIPTSRHAWLKKNQYFNGRVIVLPESSDEKEIAETYQLLDVYVHTTRRGEAFGNSLNEAMVWSLPIIVENTPHWDNGQLEQVENGVTGYIVQSVGGLVEAIGDLVTHADKRQALGTSGRAKVVREFDESRGLAQYALAYEQLVQNRDTLVLDALFPTADDIVSYTERYRALCSLDYPHRARWSLETMHAARYWYWRLIDSLVARGFIKL